MQTRSQILIAGSLCAFAIGCTTSHPVAKTDPSAARGVAGQTTNYLGEMNIMNHDDGNQAAAKVRFVRMFDIVNKDPDNLFAELRHKAKVDGEIYELHGSAKLLKHIEQQKSWNANVPTMYILSTHKDVIEALDNHTAFAVLPYQKIMDASVGNFMLGHENDKVNNEKAGMRKALASEGLETMEYKGDTAEMARLRKIIAQLAQEAIAAGTDKEGNLDVVKSVSRLVPVRMNGDYFGFPGPSDKKMLEWSRATQHAFFHNPNQSEKVNKKAIEAGKEMQAYIKDDLLPEVRAELAGPSPTRPVNDAVTRIMADSDKIASNPQAAAMGMTPERMVTNTQGLLVGSVETSSAAIVQAMKVIFDRPDVLAMAQKAAANNDNVTLSKIVWEALRFDPVNPWVVRVATQDYSFKEGPNQVEVKIPKGAVVFIATRSAMHDEEFFPAPEVFDINRPQSEFTHLGWGYHRCLGDQVALVMVPEIIKQMLILRNVTMIDKKIDFDHGPFPESWKIRYELPARPSFEARADAALKTADGFKGLLGVIHSLIESSPEKAQTLKAMEALLPGVSPEKRESALHDLPALITTAEGKLSTEERAQLCLNKNPKSLEVFPKKDEREYYCHVNITFRACYFIERLIVKQSSRPSYEYCVYNRKFLSEAEQDDFKLHMGNHPQFNFLTENLTGLDQK